MSAAYQVCINHRLAYVIYGPNTVVEAKIPPVGGRTFHGFSKESVAARCARYKARRYKHHFVYRAKPKP